MSMDQLQISHSLKYNGKGPLRSIFRSCGLRLAMHRYPGEGLLSPHNLPQGPPNPSNHILGVIHHRPQVLYIFGILWSRPQPSCS